MAMAAGCGKKKVDYSLNEPTNTGGSVNKSDDADLKRTLNVPDSCNETIIEVSDEAVIDYSMINCENIEVPDVSSMDIVHYDKYNVTPEVKKSFAEALFEKDKGIYKYDYDNPTKADLQKEIDRIEALLNQNKIASVDDQGRIEELNQRLDEFNRAYDKAPEKYPEADNYEDTTYIGTANDEEYMFSMGESDSYIWLDFYNRDILKLRPNDEAEACSLGTDHLIDDPEPRENTSEMNAEEACSIAGDFLEQIGFDDVICTQIADLDWLYTKYDGRSVATETEGYSVKFARSIGGASANDDEYLSLQTLNKAGYYSGLPAESFEVNVYKEKVISMHLCLWCGTRLDVEKNVKLLTFDEIIEKAKMHFPEYYEKYPTEYDVDVFSKAKLTYMLMSDGKNRYKYVPVWAFSESYEFRDYDGSISYYTFQLILMDATTGEIIDYVEERNKF